MKPTINFSDREYIISHGKKPSGRGMWLFQMSANDDCSKWFGACGTLTEAKKAAKAEYIKRYPNADGYVYITVLP